MISVRDQPESQYKHGNSSRTTVFLAKRASTSDADGPKAFLYQVSASESYWSSQETSATTFLTLLHTALYSTLLVDYYGTARLNRENKGTLVVTLAVTEEESGLGGVDGRRVRSGG